MSTKESIKSISIIAVSNIVTVAYCRKWNRLSRSLIAVKGIQNESLSLMTGPYTRLLNCSHATASPTSFQHCWCVQPLLYTLGERRGNEMSPPPSSLLPHLLLYAFLPQKARKRKKLNIFQYKFAPTLPPVVNSLTLKMLEKSVFEIFSPCLPPSSWSSFSKGGWPRVPNQSECDLR